MTLRRCFIDMDGVIVDYDALKVKLGVHGDALKYMPGAFLQMEPVPLAIESVRTIISMGWDVYIATRPASRAPQTYADKAHWVLRFLPELRKKIIMTQNKSLLGNEQDVLIDDRPWLSEGFRGTLVPFPNTSMWPEVIQTLKEIAK